MRRLAAATLMCAGSPRRRTAVLLGAAAIAAAATRLAALEPVSHYHDLVAGAGLAGFLDGPFQQAQFRGPAGLAVLPQRQLLLVADRDNHRVRAIHLGESHRVQTLAGTGTPGAADGALSSASFHSPAMIVAISEDAAVVYDEGSARLRLVDLAKGRVETIAGNGEHGVGEGPAREVPLGQVWSLLFVPAEDALYLSQPEHGALRRLLLKSRTVETVLLGNPSLPQPGALALLGEKIHVADRDGRIMRLSPRGANGRPVLALIARIERLMAMAGSAGLLYATHLIGDREISWTCVTTGERGAVPKAVTDAPDAVWLRAVSDGPGGFVADPRGERSFFLTDPGLHSILSVRDYRFGKFPGARTTTDTGLMDFAYPEKKPAGTFRILLLGDSRMYFFALNPPRPPASEPRMETVPKRLELYLNTLAALEDRGQRFEVLNVARASWEPLLVWPNYHAVPLVRTFDVDLVLLMQPPSSTTLDTYLNWPITEAGLPAAAIDPEYVLEPHSRKMRGNPAAAFVNRARQLGWVKPQGKDQVYISEEMPVIVTDAVARRELLALYARPLGALREGVRAARPQTRFALCYFPFARRGSGIAERAFWRDLASKTGADFLDTLDAFTGLGDTWFPYSDAGGYDHLTPQGHTFFAFVIAHQLLASGLLPDRDGEAPRVRAAELPSPTTARAPAAAAEAAPRRAARPSAGLAAGMGAAGGILVGFLSARLWRRRGP